MDPAVYGLIGTVLGGLVVSAGAWLNHHYTLKREEKQWERQQESEREKIKREDKKAEQEKLEMSKEKVSEVYQNCIHYLSLLIAKESDETYHITGEKRVQAIEEAQKWLAILSLRVGNQLGYLDFFTSQPNEYAEDLRKSVIVLAAQDEELPLYSRKRLIEPVADKNNSKEQDGQMTFGLSVDSEFRKEQLIEGIKIPIKFSFSLKFEDLTKEQRKLLVEICFNKHRENIQSSILLGLPVIDSQNKKEILKGSGNPWIIKFNPQTVEKKEILERWRKDYLTELERLEKLVSNNNATEIL